MANDQNKTQVDKERYFDNYDTKKRWNSYYHQINEVRKTEAENVLEVGIGNGTVNFYLQEVLNLDVTTLDIDEDLNPDIVGNVLDLPFERDSFNTILCAEILEHIPFEKFEKALSELRRVSNNYVVITLPHKAFDVRFSVKFIPFVERKKLLLKIPLYRFLEHNFDGEHYWEIGKKNFPLSKIENKLSEFFEIKKSYCPFEQPSHRFFVLEAK